MAAIRLRAGQLGDWYRSHRRRPQPAPDSDDSTSQTPADASANATAPDSDAPARSEDSADTVTVEERGTQGQRWATLARQQKLPRFIRRYAQRHWMAKEAKAIERLAGRRDADENRDTRIPDSEQVRIAVIWLTELYTSTTLAGLLNGLPPLIAKADDPNPERGDFADWVQAARRQGGGSYRMLPEVLPPGSPHLSTQIIDCLPAGITSVTLGIYTLTSTVTAVTAAFHVQEDHAQELQRIINQDVSTKAIPRANGGYSISGVRSQKEQAADGWRESLRTETANWLAARLPGSFHQLRPSQPPIIELFLTDKQRPWEEQADSGGIRGWTQLLDLEDLEPYWQCNSMPWLRLRERHFHGWNPSQQNVLILAALRPDLLTMSPTSRDATNDLRQAIHLLHLYIVPLANRWALTALLRELDEQLAATRDLAQRATSERKPKDLDQIRDQVIGTGLDGQIVAADIIRYASDDRSWRYEVLDFTEVVPPALTGTLTPRTSLAEALRQGQIDRGTMITSAEANLRDLLSSTAQLTAAAENIRLQRRVWWLTIVSLIVAAIAAAATVATFYNPGTTPTPAPTVRPSPTQT